MKRSDQRRPPPLPTNRPRSGLEVNTAYVLFSNDARVPGLRWVNFWGSITKWTNNAGQIVRWQ